MRFFGRAFLIIGIFLVTLVMFACASAPVRWYLKPESPWRVAVVDKTVPHPDYREHAALFWTLRHEKIHSSRGSRDWTLDQHYVGFTPTPDNADQRGEGRDLTDADLNNADLLFVADTYGVYEGDFLGTREAAALDYSARIYGGLSSEEAAVVARFADRDGGHLIAEFNTFASPTPPSARATMERLLGLHWTGWTGRHFPELSDETEVPGWARREYARQNEEEWTFSGPGYLLVHEDTTLFVLREAIEVTRTGLTIHANASGAMMDGVLEGVAFSYWFDIVTADAASEVPAMFHFDLLDAGRTLTDRFGVPVQFPAVVVASRDPLRMYFAGDFSDAGSNLGPHWLEGLPWLNKKLMSTWFPGAASQGAFYWGFYIPLLRNTFAAVTP